MKNSVHVSPKKALELESFEISSEEFLKQKIVEEIPSRITEEIIEEIPELLP